MSNKYQVSDFPFALQLIADVYGETVFEEVEALIDGDNYMLTLCLIYDACTRFWFRDVQAVLKDHNLANVDPKDHNSCVVARRDLLTQYAKVYADKRADTDLTAIELLEAIDAKLADKPWLKSDGVAIAEQLA